MSTRATMEVYRGARVSTHPNAKQGAKNEMQQEPHPTESQRPTQQQRCPSQDRCSTGGAALLALTALLPLIMN